jgi:hypothetical protein
MNALLALVVFFFQITGGSFGGSRWGARSSSPRVSAPRVSAPRFNTYRAAPVTTYRSAPVTTYRPAPAISYRPAPRYGTLRVVNTYRPPQQPTRVFVMRPLPLSPLPDRVYAVQPLVPEPPEEAAVHHETRENHTGFMTSPNLSSWVWVAYGAIIAVLVWLFYRSLR